MVCKFLELPRAKQELPMQILIVDVIFPPYAIDLVRLYKGSIKKAIFSLFNSAK